MPKLKFKLNVPQREFMEMVCLLEDHGIEVPSPKGSYLYERRQILSILAKSGASQNDQSEWVIPEDKLDETKVKIKACIARFKESNPGHQFQIIDVLEKEFL